MSDFDPDAFLAQAPTTEEPVAPVAAAQAPAPLAAASQGAQPSPDGFDPDAFLSSNPDPQYEGLTETVKAGARGVAKGLLGPLAPLAEHRYLETPYEEIKGSEEAHPYVTGAGQVAGLLSPIGEGAIMAKAGEGTAAALGLAAPTTYFGRIGSEVVKQAAEMAVLQSGDEVAKRIMSDDPGSTESALANVGLAAAIGGAGGLFMAGIASPIWKATVGSKLEVALENLSSRLGGKEVPDGIAQDLMNKSGVVMPPEIAAKIEGGAMANRYDSKLAQTDSTMAGRGYQKTVNEYRASLGDEAAKSLGNDAAYVENLGDVDKYGTGQKQVMKLHDELKASAEPIIEDYGKVNDQFKNSPVSGATQVQIRDDLSKLALEKGWAKAADEQEMKLVEKTLLKLPDQTTAKDLKAFITNLRDSNPYMSPSFRAARDIARVIEDGLGRTISEGVEASGGKAGIDIAGYQELKGRYKELMSKFEELDEHLHVGKWDGPRTFLSALDKLGTSKGEIALGRLSGTNRAQVLELLGKYAPETLASVRQYHVDRLLTAAKENGGINPTKLVKLLNNEKQFSPQIKNLIAGPEAQEKLQAIATITERMKDPTHNFSNTARTINKQNEHAATPLELLATMLGHGGAAVLSHLGKLGLNEGIDGARLGMMRFVGSNQPIKSEGLKSFMTFANHAYKGENTLANSVKAVLKPGAQVLATKLIPDAKDREKLDKLVVKTQDNPQHLVAATQSDLGHYASGHQANAAKTVTAAMTYLQALKPKGQKFSPLDPEIPPSTAQVGRYNRALDIALQPAIVLKHVNEGTIQLTDLQDLQHMYPNYFQNMCAQLTNETFKAASEGTVIPYKTKMAISLCLGQPMDSSMKPESIIAAQPKAPQQPQMPKASNTLGKSNKMYNTPNQGAERARAARD